jgi:thiol-disulfide isomerase/thioredoxin
MGVSVSIVSTGNPQIDDYRVESLNPAVGDLQIGFCSHVGQFDSLVDTISDEQGSSAEAPINDGFETSGVLQLLRSRHKCESYISTMTASQRIIRDDGVLFGPGKAKDHVKQIDKGRPATQIIPPPGFGTTVQTLLDEGITFSWKQEGNTLLRTWTLPALLELTSWPRDSDGGSNVRFGFPVVDDLDNSDDNDDQDVDDADDADEVDGKGGSNPFITDISSVQDLNREVVSKERDCVLFLSAKYCRTCKTIAPSYTRFARMNQLDDLLFCRADTTGPKGKELGKILQVNAVPLFVLFKQGERFGTPLLINKLPSKKLDLALEFLRTGSKWDTAALEKVKEADEKRRK